LEAKTAPSKNRKGNPKMDTLWKDKPRLKRVLPSAKTGYEKTLPAGKKRKRRGRAPDGGGSGVLPLQSLKTETGKKKPHGMGSAGGRREASAKKVCVVFFVPSGGQSMGRTEKRKGRLLSGNCSNTAEGNVV